MLVEMIAHRHIHHHLETDSCCHAGNRPMLLRDRMQVCLDCKFSKKNCYVVEQCRHACIRLNAIEQNG